MLCLRKYEVQKKVDFLFFSKNIYLFITIYFVPFKVIPLRYYTLVPALFPIFEALLICVFWLFIALSSSSDVVIFISSIVANFRPFMGLFNFGNKRKSQGAKSGEYGVVFGQKP